MRWQRKTATALASPDESGGEWPAEALPWQPAGVTNAPSRATLSGHVKEAEPTLRDLSMRGEHQQDKHHAFTERGQDRRIADHVIEAARRSADHRALRRQRAA
jgi:hypothetical protein